MEPRIDLYASAHADAVKAMMGLEAYVRRSGLEASLLHLIKTRASQLNGCAYCIDMHTKDARAEGETGAASLRLKRLARDAVFH